MANNIGIDVPEPKETCQDRHCPFHGDMRVRGNVFVGIVIASKIKKTATVEKKWRHYIPKYERYEERRSRLRVHNPLCIDAREGEKVLIMESRPISKTKKFVIVQKMVEAEKK